MVPLTSTGPEVFFATMTKFLSDSYDAFEETLTHTKSLKIKRYRGENVTDCCAEMLVDAERLEIDGAFKPEPLGYTTCIFEDTSDLCDMYVISQEDLITYESLVQEVTRERWEPTTSK